MHFTTTEIARAVHGTRDSTATGDRDVEGVTIDSRTVSGGELFVPIVAERDGHEFIDAALAAGAAAFLTQAGAGDDRPGAIHVADTAAALLDLGRHARTRVPDRVIGITGSVGKTTVKDLTAAALASTYVTHASPRSFNNELGVPLTLANAPDDIGAVVLEMGARGRGHIALLCDIGRPTIGVVTTVALAHAEMFGTIEDVAVAKGELVEALPRDGTAVLNGDHPLVAAMASRTAARVVTFGVESSEGVDVTASAVAIDDELRPSFRLHSPWGSVPIVLPVRGAHQVMNALAAAAAAMAAGVSPEAAAEGLRVAQSSPWRMELHRSPSGRTVLNDAYNANPTSMAAALRSLATLPGRDRVAVVGVMAELGPDGPAEHLRIAALAADLGIRLVAVGTDLYGLDPVEPDDTAAGIDQIVDAVGDADVVLVKGSRVAGLERIAARLLET